MVNSDQWRWLWCLHIPQRCKIFLWLALNDSLPTEESPSEISDFACSPCPFCHRHETLLHVLRDCPRARSVWVHLVAPQHQHGFFSCSLWNWMVTYLQQPWSSVNSDGDGALFAATVWLLWKDRKSWVPDGRGFCPERVLQRVGALAHDYGRVVEVEHSAPTTAVRNLSWCFYWNQPPSHLQLRSLVDGSRLAFPKL
uniref:Ribonuclease H protein At1g65750 family n=1 Tax=Cajanus cajan TaxID=3821 RepID=A0A151R8M6_CAJCA|nr:Putative ribonuclease H protein At1g65750 family [Cajanus cajan]